MTKKTILAVLLLALLAATLTASAASPVHITIDGNRLQIPSGEPGAYISSEGRTLIPVSFVARGLGAEVAWFEETQNVVITGNGQMVSLVIGDRDATVNERRFRLDTPALITRSRTFVPLRFVSEGLGANVAWDGPNRTVVITTDGSEPQIGALPPMITEITQADIDRIRAYPPLEGVRMNSMSVEDATGWMKKHKRDAPELIIYSMLMDPRLVYKSFTGEIFRGVWTKTENGRTYQADGELCLRSGRFPPDWREISDYCLDPRQLSEWREVQP